MLQRYSNKILNNLKHINPIVNKSKLSYGRLMTDHVKDTEEKIQQKKILQDNLGFTYQQSAALLRNNGYLQIVDNNRLLNTILCLKKMGIQSDDIYEFPMVLAIHNNSVEHNVKYLREIGFTHISAEFLLRYRSTVKRPVSLLKAHNIIPDGIHVPKRLFSHCHPKPNYLPILDKFSDEDSVRHIHETVFKHYLVWRLETTLKEVENLCETYDRFKYKSYQVMSDMIKLLLEEVGFTKRKLLNNGYLLQIGPQAVRDFMDMYPTLAGVDVKTVFCKYPKIVSVPVDSITAILRYLKDFNVSDGAIRKCFEIFTLAPSSVEFRLNELLKVPEFAVLSKNLRFPQLVLHQNKAKLRLEHLQRNNVKCASINVLCASDAVFERYAMDGSDKTKGFDMVYYLSAELNEPFKAIRKKLSRNPHWCHVPLTTVQTTLRYLLMKNFSRDEICRMPIILLYSREKVDKAFLEIRTNPEICADQLTVREQLNLCLYFIERNYHFSGDGVFLDAYRQDGSVPVV